MTQPAYRELTISAVVLGILQGVILNVAFVYAALKLGFSIGGSTVAAIMGYAILRGVLKTRHDGREQHQSDHRVGHQHGRDGHGVYDSGTLHVGRQAASGRQSGA